MMQRLFWRIFAAFWLATVIVLLAFAWVTADFFENAKIPGLQVTRLQASMDDDLARTARKLRHDGEAQTRHWISSADQFGSISVYVVGSDGDEILGRSLSESVRTAANEALAAPIATRPENGGDRVRYRQVQTRDEHVYAVVAALEGNFLTRLVLRRANVFWTHVIVAMIVSALFSFGLAWYVTAPLTSIRASTRRFAEGDLDARVGRLRHGRSTEMRALAEEFDSMASRIKALVESHRRLVRDVSHELRSPLARQRVALELARDGDTAQVHASLDRIECESDRLESMLSQALELSRLETASGPANDDVALDALLEDVITNADYEGAPRGRKVVLAECERLSLTGSRAALYSAFENIIRNALAYTADGSTVSVRLRRDHASRDDAVALVRDHGPGVGEADLTRIFEPFFRTDSARMRSSGGTGLGLAIAHRAISSHGGSIVARNAGDGGLEVEIRLPLSRH